VRRISSARRVHLAGDGDQQVQRLAGAEAMDGHRQVADLPVAGIELGAVGDAHHRRGEGGIGGNDLGDVVGALVRIVDDRLDLDHGLRQDGELGFAAVEALADARRQFLGMHVRPLRPSGG
jgi:hypothetical protein